MGNAFALEECANELCASVLEARELDSTVDIRGLVSRSDLECSVQFYDRAISILRVLYGLDNEDVSKLEQKALEFKNILRLHHSWTDPKTFSCISTQFDRRHLAKRNGSYRNRSGLESTIAPVQ